MAIRTGFYGVSSYDTIQYLARILYNAGESVLMLDLSEDHSLAYSVPVPEELKDDVVDYRGVAFSIHYEPDMDFDYSQILIYFGLANPKLPVDYAFLLTDCERVTLNVIKRAMHRIQFRKGSLQENEIHDGQFMPATPNVIIYGVAASTRQKYILAELGIDENDCELLELDDVDLEARLLCQFDTVFRFKKISELYRTILIAMAESLLRNKITKKELRKAYKKAERGK